MVVPLFWRALLAFLALPTIIAGVIPWFFLRPAAPRFVGAGVPLIALGVVLLLWCVGEFYVAGKGTLAPWDPPRQLVITGPYRYTRNPMYVAVLTILVGWAVCLDIGTNRTPLYYALLMATIFHLRVLLFEEPWAARTFGAAWTDYVARVPRWLFRVRRHPLLRDRSLQMSFDDATGRRILLIVIPRSAPYEAHFFVGVANIDADGLELDGRTGAEPVYVAARRDFLRFFDPRVLPRLIRRKDWPAVERLSQGVERCVSVFADGAPPGGLVRHQAFFAMAENANGQPVLFQGDEDDDDGA